MEITDILGTSTAGLVNVRISLTDSSGNAASAGLTDPDGTTTANAGVIGSDARVFEFDHRLNEGVSAVKDVFVVSPNTGTAAAPETDVGSPLITVNFDNTTGVGGEDKEYTATTIEVDTHDNITITSAIWGFPDGTTKDVLADLNQADDNSYFFSPSGLAVGIHTFTVQARDEVGNVSTSIGSTTPTSFTLTLVVTASLCGDLTSDGTVNVFDAIILLQIAVGLVESTPTQLVLGDLNRDGVLNVFDAITLLQMSVGLVTVTECGPIA